MFLRIEEINDAISSYVMIRDRVVVQNSMVGGEPHVVQQDK